MELYQAILFKTAELTAGLPCRSFPYREDACWPETAGFELVMGRDAALELGGSNLPSANYTCVTSVPGSVTKDEVALFGPDIGALKGNSPYVRIALVEMDDSLNTPELDADTQCRGIQAIDFVKYHVFPEGFMMRTSSMDNREQVRVSRKAVADGISFETIGNTFIRRYHENPHVKKVRLLFITAPEADFKALRQCAQDTAAITRALNGILEGMPTDCHSCSLKPVCDEVEGMKELHFKKTRR